MIYQLFIHYYIAWRELAFDWDYKLIVEMELDDEFSLDSKEQAQGSKVAQSKSMKAVYEQLAKKAIKQESGTKQIKK